MYEQETSFRFLETTDCIPARPISVEQRHDIAIGAEVQVVRIVTEARTRTTRPTEAVAADIDQHAAIVEART